MAEMAARLKWLTVSVLAGLLILNCRHRMCQQISLAPAGPQADSRLPIALTASFLHQIYSWGTFPRSLCPKRL
jgi:hypothetical protein